MDDFFDNILGGLGKGVGGFLETTGTRILPIWTAGQLNLQRVDQLNRPTFNPFFAPATPNVGVTTTAAVPQTAPSSFGGLTTNQMFMIAIVGVGAVILVTAL